MKLFIVAAALAAVANADVIKQCKKNGVFAMTWDDGPAAYTAQLLGILGSKGVKATFHLTTQNLTDPNVQSLVKKINGAGHLIGIRTEPNWDISAMSADQLKSAVARQSAVLSQFIGYYTKLVRLPYDKCDAKTVGALESAGAIITQHNLESYDYTGSSERIRSAFSLTLSLKPASNYSLISVQHDAIKASVSVTGQIIDDIKKAGYKLVTLDECVGAGNLRQNKTPLKGGSGDSGDIPTLGGGSTSVGGGDEDGEASTDGKKKKGGLLKGLSGASESESVNMFMMAGMMLAALLLN